MTHQSHRLLNSSNCPCTPLSLARTSVMAHQSHRLLLHHSTTWTPTTLWPIKQWGRSIKQWGRIKIQKQWGQQLRRRCHQLDSPSQLASLVTRKPSALHALSSRLFLCHHRQPKLQLRHHRNRHQLCPMHHQSHQRHLWHRYLQRRPSSQRPHRQHQLATTRKLHQLCVAAHV